MNVCVDSHKTIKILDCTIRDGGYLNNWNFDKKTVRDNQMLVLTLLS